MCPHNTVMRGDRCTLHNTFLGNECPGHSELLTVRVKNVGKKIKKKRFKL